MRVISELVTIQSKRSSDGMDMAAEFSSQVTNHRALIMSYCNTTFQQIYYSTCLQEREIDCFIPGLHEEDHSNSNHYLIILRRRYDIYIYPVLINPIVHSI